VVREINKNFGRSFKKIGCSGEVELHEEVDPETGLHDFAHYAIHIKVKFRAEEDLQLLTAHRQSGGERSVSTIFYLIAIQVSFPSPSLILSCTGAHVPILFAARYTDLMATPLLLLDSSFYKVLDV
jgi:chromosome segregation ATPase